MTTPASVEAYLAAVPEPARSVLQDLRATIKEAVPDAEEAISYQMPGIRAGGRFVVWYAAFKDHCSLFPASEGVKAALGEELAPYLVGKGTIRFQPDDPLPPPLVREIVRIRIEENAAGRS